MIAYDKKGLDGITFRDAAAGWLKKGFISAETKHAIENAYPATFTPNIFVRILLFIFTIIGASMAGGTIGLALTAAVENETGAGFVGFVYGVIVIGSLDFYIREKKAFRSGIDDALLYIGLSCFIGSFCLIFRTDNIDSVALVAFPLLLIAAIRYTDMLLSLAAYIVAFYLFFAGLSELGTYAKAVIPFCFMGLAALSYWLINKYHNNEELRYWKHCFFLLEIAALLIFYLAGNYFVVRELTVAMFDLIVEPGSDIPFAFLFYAFTVTIPLFYIYRGLKGHDRTLLITGFIILAFSVFTFKYYYSLGHHEISMTIGGIILIAVAWWSIRYLHTPKHGITYEEDKDRKKNFGLDPEALAIAQTFGHTHHHTDKPIEFGGGKSGGGGADADF